MTDELIEVLLRINEELRNINKRIDALEEQLPINHNQSTDEKPQFFSLDGIEKSEELRKKENLDDLLDKSAILAIEHFRRYPPKRIT